MILELFLHFTLAHLLEGPAIIIENIILYHFDSSNYDTAWEKTENSPSTTGSLLHTKASPVLYPQLHKDHSSHP